MSLSVSTSTAMVYASIRQHAYTDMVCVPIIIIIIIIVIIIIIIIIIRHYCSGYLGGGSAQPAPLPNLSFAPGQSPVPITAHVRWFTCQSTMRPPLKAAAKSSEESSGSSDVVTEAVTFENLLEEHVQNLWDDILRAPTAAGRFWGWCAAVYGCITSVYGGNAAVYGCFASVCRGHAAVHGRASVGGGDDAVSASEDAVCGCLSSEARMQCRHAWRRCSG
eukprot:421257-Rhodomonas_salina.2